MLTRKVKFKQTDTVYALIALTGEGAVIEDMEGNLSNVAVNQLQMVPPTCEVEKKQVEKNNRIVKGLGD